jgi:hypothetical protein
LTAVIDPPPVVRVRPAPRIDPVFDDVPETPVVRCAGQLAMPRRLWSGTPAGAGEAGQEEPRPKAPSADAHAAAHRFVEACAEILNGYRPIAHLRPHTSPLDFATVVDHLTRRAVRVHRASGGSRDGRARIAVRRVRVCEPRAGIAEVAAVLDHRDGSWAMAVRLERRRDRWTCTSLQVL